MVLYPFFSFSCRGVERMIPLCVSLWYKVCMLDESPLTMTLPIRRSCHEPPILSGVPPAVKHQYHDLKLNTEWTYVGRRSPYHQYLIMV
jgi:hypothetical protein